MFQMHNADSEMASVACSERSDTSRTETLLYRTTSEATLVLVRYQGEDTLANLPDRTYDKLLREIVRVYKFTEKSPFDLVAVERHLADGSWVTVDAGAWERQFDVIKDDLPLFRLTMVRRKAVLTGEMITLNVLTLTGKTYSRQIPISINEFATMRALKEVLMDREGIPPEQQRLIFRGKPVIYLFPPTSLDSATVSVTLTPEWHFCALCPVVDPVKGGSGETRASWTVSAQPDGSLVDLASGLELNYLFWEAEAYKTTSSAPSHFAFDPSNPSLDASNGCTLPFTSFLAYLDKTLATLSLHTAARNDFVTFWLSHFTRIRDAGQHIGFRFLAQADYERAARLDVDPKPDVITRVFLLFKGVGAEEAQEWKKPDGADWAKEVGIQVDKVKDKSLFRVLKWGGMEVV
ncbi:hypothetical protein JCM10296v2_007775 [Rhodotorula toruloides]